METLIFKRKKSIFIFSYVKAIYLFSKMVLVEQALTDSEVSVLIQCCFQNAKQPMCHFKWTVVNQGENEVMLVHKLLLWSKLKLRPVPTVIIGLLCRPQKHDVVQLLMHNNNHSFNKVSSTTKGHFRVSREEFLAIQEERKMAKTSMNDRPMVLPFSIFEAMIFLCGTY